MPAPARCDDCEPRLFPGAYGTFHRVFVCGELQGGRAMSRGPPPKKAIELAIPYAHARGYVIFSRRQRGSVCDLVILGSGRTTIVCMARSKHIRGSLAEMETQLAGAAAGLRSIPPDPGWVYEIWACNYYRGIRFFRVERARLLEIDRDGKPFYDSGGTPLP